MSDQLKNLLSQALTAIGMYFVGRGWITTDLLTSTIIPGIITLAGIGYGFYLNTRGAKVAAVATPGTMVVLPVAESRLAETLPNNVQTTANVAVVAK